MTDTDRLGGMEAIEYVEAMLAEYDWAENGAPTLSKYEDPTEGHRTDLTPEDARAVAAEDPSLIYYDRHV